ncbi:MAG: tetratricopeptide repeat protein [Fibrobacterales bacterium]
MYSVLSKIMVKRLVPLLLMQLLVFGCGSIESDARRSLQMEDYQRAERLYTRALDGDPLNGALRLEYIEALIGVIDFYDTLTVKHAYFLDRLVGESTIATHVALPLQKRDSIVGVLYAKGYSYYSQNSYGDAERYFSAAYALKGTDVEVNNVLALTCSKLRQDERTIALFTDLLNHYPRFVSAYINLGNHYWAKGDVEEAYITWSLGIEVAPNDFYLKKWVQIAHDELILLTLGEE